ncbi:MAG: NAD(P)H-dependent oxidoreductase [Acidobacteriota bacterium]|nr:NAD(P)H-dependent oxidoreductase [Acidobacteriota bacterium]
MNPLAAPSLLDALQWRYATKLFDPTRRIPTDQWTALEQSLVLTPSSYGLQPWKFIVVTDPALKAKLRPVSWNQSQIEDCSHLVVFLAKEDITEGDLDRFIARSAEVRGVPPESLAGYRGYMLGDLVKGPRHAVIAEWAARQVYIALGQFMACAALLGIDTCPMEGLEPAKYDEILGLKGTGYHTLAACPAGYRSPEDKYARLPKVRYETGDVIEQR